MSFRLNSKGLGGSLLSIFEITTVGVMTAFTGCCLGVRILLTGRLMTDLKVLKVLWLQHILLFFNCSVQFKCSSSFANN